MATGALAELAIRITSKDDASPAVTSMGAKIRKELGDIAKIAAGLVLGNITQNLGGDIAQKLQQGAEAFDKFGNSVATVQRLTGESADTASVLLGTLTRYGMGADQASTALIKLQRSIAGTEDATDIVTAGGKSGAQQLKELGISALDAAGHAQTASNVMLQLADAIKGKTATEQVGIISTVFKVRGNEAADIQRVLMQGRAAIEDYFSFLRASGNTVSQEQINDVLAYGEAHRRLDAALRGVAIQFDAGFAPALTSAATVAANLGKVLNGAVMPTIERIPLLLPALVTGLGVLLSAALIGSTAQMVKFVAVGLIQTEQAIVKLMIPLSGLIARYAAVAVAAAAAAAAQVAAWLAAAGPIVLIIGGIVLAAGAIALVLSGKLGEAKDAIGAGLQKIGQAVKDGWDAIRKLNTPFEIPDVKGPGVTPPPDLETQAEKAGKEAKAAVDRALKGVQDAAAQRKDTFELTQIEPNRAALEAKLAETQATQALLPLKRELEDLDNSAVDVANKRLKAVQDEAAVRKDLFTLSTLGAERAVLQTTLDETVANNALISSKRALEDVDRSTIDYAHQRLVIAQDEATTQAKIGEEKLKNAADDLSYQEKLLLAQARAAKMRGENVDMSALRAQVLSIRQQQIQNEPALLEAQHNTALADRAKNATGMGDQLQKDAVDRQKIDINEGAQPLKDEALTRTRLAEDAAKVLDLDKQRFAISETFYTAQLLQAQTAAKAAQEAYTAAEDAIKAQMKPLEAIQTLTSRAAQDAQNLLELDKANFAIRETYYAKDLLLAQAASKAADEAYQKTVDAVAAAAAKGESPPTSATFWNPSTSQYEPIRPTAPLPAGVVSSSAAPAPITANVTVNVDTASADTAAEALRQAAIDGTLEALRAAQRNMTGGPPASHTLPGAFAAGTP